MKIYKGYQGRERKALCYRRMHSNTCRSNKILEKSSFLISKVIIDFFAKRVSMDAKTQWEQSFTHRLLTKCKGETDVYNVEIQWLPPYPVVKPESWFPWRDLSMYLTFPGIQEHLAWSPKTHGETTCNL